MSRHTTQKLAVLVSLLSLFAVLPALSQEHNVTVLDTDPSITYAGTGTGPATICKFDAAGNILGGQPGCYFIPSNCTSSVAMSQNTDHNAAASFKFKGSAIYINSALFDISPVYTVTLDGQASDADGARPSSTFTCASLFSKTGLDPAVEHTIQLSVKGPSSNRNTTVDPDGSEDGSDLPFSLINFIYTVPDSTSTSNTTSGGATNPAPTTSTGNTGSTTPSNSNTNSSAPSPNTTQGSGAVGARTAMPLFSLGLSAFLGATAFMA